MKISWIKYYKDKKSFKMIENLGLDVFKVFELEETDEKIKQLVNEQYDTIILSNQVASSSQDIIKKYGKNSNIKIIISPRND